MLFVKTKNRFKIPQLYSLWNSRHINTLTKSCNAHLILKKFNPMMTSNDAYSNAISHLASLVIDFVEIQLVFVGMHTSSWWNRYDLWYRVYFLNSGAWYMLWIINMTWKGGDLRSCGNVRQRVATWSGQADTCRTFSVTTYTF